MQEVGIYANSLAAADFLGCHLIYTMALELSAVMDLYFIIS